MHRRLILALTCATLALGGTAHAQPAGHPPGGRHGPPSAEMKAHHEAMKTQRREDLKTVLRLRPDQEAALNAFVAAHEPKRFERRRREPHALTTPQRLEEMAKHEAEMRTHHEARRKALATFYAALSPDQQKVFDALHRLQGHHGGHGKMERGGRRMIIGRHGPGPMPDHEPPPR